MGHAAAVELCSGTPSPPASGWQVSMLLTVGALLKALTDICASHVGGPWEGARSHLLSRPQPSCIRHILAYRSWEMGHA